VGFKRRKSRRLDPASLRLPLIALIDVVLFLLMYFMVAGTMGAQEKELSTSLGVDQNKGGASHSALLPMVLKVERRDRTTIVYKLGDRSFRSQEALKVLLTSLPKESGVVIKAGDGVSVGDVAAALQACKDAGFAKISFVGGSMPLAPPLPQAPVSPAGDSR
jgi:biopolymer transport protein ExbD